MSAASADPHSGQVGGGTAVAARVAAFALAAAADIDIHEPPDESCPMNARRSVTIERVRLQSACCNRRTSMRITIVTGPFYSVPPAPCGAVEQIWHGLAAEFARRGGGRTVVCRGYPGLAPRGRANRVTYVR